MNKFNELRTLFREKLIQLKTFTFVDGNHVYIFRWILYQQGFWSALDRAEQTPPSRIRYWYPRVILASWTYLSLIGFPMAAYSVAGQPFLVLSEPIIFAVVGGFGVATAGSLLYQSKLFQETVEAFEAMRTCAKLLPEQWHQHQALRNNICNLIFVTSSSLGPIIILLIAAMLPALIPTKSLFMWSWYPYNEKTSPYYEITLAGWSVWLLSAVYLISPATSMLLILLVQAWSQLELLCHNLDLLRESDQQRAPITVVLNCGVWRRRVEVYHKDINNEMSRVLRVCVLHHQAVVRFVSTLGPTFDLMLSQLLVTFLIPLGLIIYSIKHSERINLATVWQVIALICIAFSLLLVFYFADKISDQSEMVRESVFACDWLNVSESLKRSLRIIMSFSNQPLVITVTGGITLSLATFRQLFFLTYKYYTFVIDSTSKATDESQNSVIYLAIPKN